jgi:hypothetical protein
VISSEGFDGGVTGFLTGIPLNVVLDVFAAMQVKRHKTKMSRIKTVKQILF